MADPDGCVLAIDQGTSSTKALVVTADGTVLATAESDVQPVALPGGGIEQDPGELYDSVVRAGRQALADSGVSVSAVGLANQGETVLAWERRTGEPLSPAVSWQDRRSVGVCERLAVHSEWLRRLTGLPLDPYFVGPKLLWLRESLTHAGVATTTDSWLLHRMTGSYVTDVTTASRTALLDLDRREWSHDACELFGVSPTELPEVVSCTTDIGSTDVFGDRLPVTGLAVDQQAALFGQGCRSTGDAKCTYGTGAFLLANAGPKPARSGHGLAASVAWDIDGAVAYCLDGQVYTVGSVISWMSGLGLVAGAGDIDRLGSSVPDTGGVRFVPSLAGLGAPFWQPAAKGSIDGLSLGTTAAHLVRAALEGIAAQVTLLARATAEDLGAPLGTLRVDGGLTRSRLLMQIQADLLQSPVEVFASPNATALGVAGLARIGHGCGAIDAAADRDDLPTPRGERFEPRIDAGEAAAQLAAAEAAVARLAGPT